MIDEVGNVEETTITVSKHSQGRSMNTHRHHAFAPVATLGCLAFAEEKHPHLGWFGLSLYRMPQQERRQKVPR